MILLTVLTAILVLVFFLVLAVALFHISAARFTSRSLSKKSCLRTLLPGKSPISCRTQPEISRTRRTSTEPAHQFKVTAEPPSRPLPGC